jgi:signal transduction histidine kinase
MSDLARALLDLARARPRFEFGQTATYTVRRGGQAVEVAVPLGSFPLGAHLAQKWVNLVLLAPTLALAALVFTRRLYDRVAQLFCLSVACLTSLGVIQAFVIGVGDVAHVSSFWLGRLAAYSISCLLMGATLHFALILPRPHPLVLRHRGIVPMVYALPYAGLTVYLVARLLTTGNALEWFGQWSIASDRINMVYLALTILALLLNYRAVRAKAVLRQQARWVVLGYALALILLLVLVLLPKVLTGHPILDRTRQSLLLLPAPICMAFAILRYRLFDIDLIINRALVHGSLTVFVVGMYVGVVVALSTIFRTDGNLLFSLAATGLIAAVFQPIRERVQRSVNRLMYGERDEPYAVISRLGQQLEVTLSPDAVLPAIVETVARALKLPYAAIALKQDAEMVIVAEYYDTGTRRQRDRGTEVTAERRRVSLSSSHLVTLSLTYQGDTVGELRLAPRAPNEPFSAADLRLLNDLARQAGIAVHAAKLTTDLQRARQQLVNAREEERRRIRRDLHDGLGPALASLTFKLDAARNLLRRDADRADDLLAAVTDQTQAAIADIRRLVYDLRPPVLDELGLVSALCEQVAQSQQHGIRIVFDAPERLPPLPAAVEVAAYRIAQEALTNVVRHSRARRCVVRLALEGDALCLEVHDDGHGLAAERHSGVGLHAMRERAAELGGTCVVESGPHAGTRVLARLPLPPPSEGN